MAVCNILGDIVKVNGTFFTFSQYMEDLTRKLSNPHISVIPSKYIALNMTFRIMSDDGSNQYKFDNQSFPKYLQDYFENGCAIYRTVMPNWNPSISTNLFWNALFDSGLVTLKENTQNGLTSYYVPEIMYVGDINLQSYNEHDGMGYSEIYCHIPNDAQKSIYSIKTQIDNSERFSSGETIEGYTMDELGGRGYISSPITYYPKNTHEFSWEDNDLITTKTAEDSFNINTIIILYDIYNGDVLESSNIPMGLYITGKLKNGVVTNTITKYVSNDDIYNSGTSYGLRICSRFVSSPNTDELKISEVTLEDNNYADLSRVLSQISVSQQKMDEIINRVYQENHNDKELLAIFKNSRTNVPYLKEVNGQMHWFVNGRMLTDMTANNCSCSPYSQEEMSDFINGRATLAITVHATDQNGKNIFCNVDRDSQTNEFTKASVKNINLMWSSIYRGNATTNLNELYVKTQDSEYQKLNPSMVQMTIPNISTDTTFTVKAIKDELEASASAEIKFVDPSFFGLLPCKCENKSSQNHKFTPSVDQILSLPYYAVDSRKQEYTYSNINGEHICFAYPKKYGKLNSIIDNFYINRLDADYINNDFNQYEMSLNINGNTIEYYVYVDKAVVIVNNYTLKFS